MESCSLLCLPHPKGPMRLVVERVLGQKWSKLESRKSAAATLAAPRGSWEPSLAWGSWVREAATLLGAFPDSQCGREPRQRGKSRKEKGSTHLGGSEAVDTQDGPRVSFSLPGPVLGQVEDWQRFLCWPGMVCGGRTIISTLWEGGHSLHRHGGHREVAQGPSGHWQLASRMCCDTPFAPKILGVVQDRRVGS